MVAASLLRVSPAVAQGVARGRQYDNYYYEQSIWEWAPQQDDRIVIDIANNMGYIIHPDHQYLSFKVATGQKRVVRYIGRVYFAETPAQNWTVLSQHIQPDRVTFGPRGHFLRLYQGPDESYTKYGIHSHAYIQKMLSDPDWDRYKSMGCVLVSEQIMDMLMETFAMSKENLSVLTTQDIHEYDPQFALAILSKKLAQKEL